MVWRVPTIAPAAFVFLWALAWVPAHSGTSAWGMPTAAAPAQPAIRHSLPGGTTRRLRRSSWAPSRPIRAAVPPPVAPATLPVTTAPTTAPPPAQHNGLAPVPEANHENAQLQAEQTESAATPALPWLERWQSDGTWRVVSGSQFRVALANKINSRDAAPGHPVRARLLRNLQLGGNLLAPAESLVNGTITRASSARSKLMANMSVKQWGRDDGMIRVEFSEIVSPDGKHIPIKASPAPLTVVEDPLKNHASAAVTKNGYITVAAKSHPDGSLITGAFRKGDNIFVEVGQPITLQLTEDLILISPVALGPEIAP